ncbi:MAG: acetyl-CoA carboxylase biotin carboxyl carrier protein [Deltaproteobacteria bacterium]|jgi:acetyl-CoA carboxylase biotin carboxyl carrier protein|nr:acetyl-CoA carboxylase biotin carboxyl carrier protein [Deltaproteobacteria bacterium]
MKLDLDQLRELIRLLDESNLTEIEVEHDDDRIRVRRDPAPVVGAVTSPPVGAASTTQSGEAPAAEDAGNYVTSPFVGTFYRSPSPESSAFVEVGDSIAPGQVLCIVEAMKLMNEIESEVSGTIVEILIESGKPVEYGARLFRVETS